MNKFILPIIAVAALAGIVYLLGWQATLVLLIIFAVFAAAIARRSRVAPSCCGGGTVEGPQESGCGCADLSQQLTEQNQEVPTMNDSDIRLRVANMSCDGCVNSIKGRLQPLAGEENVEVSLRERTVVLHGGLSAEQAIAELDKIGFQAERA